MNKYRLICKKGEGTFSEVLKAQSLKNQKYVAIKCMKNHFDSIDKVNNLREIQALRRLSPHPHIVKLHEVLYDQPTGRLALVFELMEMNIYELIRGRRHYLQKDRVKNFLYQLVKAMDHMHRNGIFHRDIKPENILISNEELKVADFGSCRGIYSKQPYTEYISTRWYRAPECLLTDGYYGYKMDMWGIGCVMFEILALFPLFPGTNEIDQIARIHDILGTPPKEILDKFKKHATHMDFNFAAKKGTGIGKLIPHCSATCIDLIEKLLAYDPEERMSARQAMRHPYFSELRAQEKKLAKAANTSQSLPSQRMGNNSSGKSDELSSTQKGSKGSGMYLQKQVDSKTQPSSMRKSSVTSKHQSGAAKTEEGGHASQRSLPVLLNGDVRTGAVKLGVQKHKTQQQQSGEPTKQQQEKGAESQLHQHGAHQRHQKQSTYTRYRADGIAVKNLGIRKNDHGITKNKSKYQQYHIHARNHKKQTHVSKSSALPPIGHSEHVPSIAKKYISGMKGTSTHYRHNMEKRRGLDPYQHRNQVDSHQGRKGHKATRFPSHNKQPLKAYEKSSVGRGAGNMYGFSSKRSATSKLYQSPYSQKYLKTHVPGM